MNGWARVEASPRPPQFDLECTFELQCVEKVKSHRFDIMGTEVPVVLVAAAMATASSSDGCFNAISAPTRSSLPFSWPDASSW